MDITVDYSIQKKTDIDYGNRKKTNDEMFQYIRYYVENSDKRLNSNEI